MVFFCWFLLLLLNLSVCWFFFFFSMLCERVFVWVSLNCYCFPRFYLCECEWSRSLVILKNIISLFSSWWLWMFLMGFVDVSSFAYLLQMFLICYRLHNNGWIMHVYPTNRCFPVCFVICVSVRCFWRWATNKMAINGRGYRTNTLKRKLNCWKYCKIVDRCSTRMFVLKHK